MKLVRYTRVGAGTVVVAAAVIGVAWMIGLDLFNSTEWGLSQSHAQSAPRAPAAKPPAAKAPAPASPGQGPAPGATQRTERTVYDSWTVTCSETVEKVAKKTC